MCGCNTNVLSGDFGPGGNPDVSYSKPGAYSAGVVDRTVTVAVSNNEDVLLWESVQGILDSMLNAACGFVAVDDQSGFSCLLLVRL